MLPEFVEMLSAFTACEVEYVVVGGYAVGAHLEPRSTKDIDLFVRPTARNAKRVLKALVRFGAPLFDLSARDLATPDMVFQIGVPPRRIDVLTGISGVTFDEAWRSRLAVHVGGVDGPVFFIGREALIRNKRASGRPQDLVDAARLEEPSGTVSKPSSKRKRKRR